MAKAYGHFITVNYRESYDFLPAQGYFSTTRAPRRGREFVTRKVTYNAAAIKLGIQDKLHLGNLDARRDWGYAKDYVEAMWMMLQQDEPDDYVIATGKDHSVRDLVEVAFGHLGLDWEDHVELDPALLRPAEVDHLIGDYSKAKAEARLGAAHVLRRAHPADGRLRHGAAVDLLGSTATGSLTAPPDLTLDQVLERLGLAGAPPARAAARGRGAGLRRAAAARVAGGPAPGRLPAVRREPARSGEHTGAAAAAGQLRGPSARSRRAASSRSPWRATAGPTVAGMPFPKVTADIMRELALLRPAFTLYTGDAIFGYKQSRQQMLNELDRFKALADTSRVPLFNVPGNHEAQSSAAAMEVLADWGHDLYGSFDFHGYHFVGLNTDEPNLEGRVTGEQLAWLEQDLRARRRRAGHVRVHAPPALLLVPGRLQPRRRARS